MGTDGKKCGKAVWKVLSQASFTCQAVGSRILRLFCMPGAWHYGVPGESATPEVGLIPYGDAMFPPLFISLFGLICAERLLPFIGLIFVLPIAFFLGVHFMVIKGIVALVLDDITLYLTNDITH